MENSVKIVDTLWTGYTFPATYYSGALDVQALGGDGGTFFITWADCSITFQLLASSHFSFGAPPDSHDWTAEYRAIDPGWIDPVLGDPSSSYPVRWKNLGLRYVKIGWTASNWTGGARYLRIMFQRDRYLR